MTYTLKCPHCRNIVKMGHGHPTKSLGTPLKHCPSCNKVYVDHTIIEWEASPIYRQLEYYLANNRWILCLIAGFIGSEHNLVLAVLFSCIALSLCYLYVNFTSSRKRFESKERIQNKDYIALLRTYKYPLKKNI